MAEKDEDEKDEKDADGADKEGEGGEGAEGEEGAPKRKGKRLIIIIVALVVLIGAAAGAYFFFFSGEDKDKKKDSKESSDTAAVEKPVFYEMQEILVNLTTGTGKPSFLKMKVTLELSKQEDVPVIEGYMPRITDSFNTYLRELRPSDLSGSAGLYRMREELIVRLNQEVAPAKVNNILFREILVQ
jgi:flagellar protein FliL